MATLLSVLAGILYAAGLYQALSRNRMRLIIGLVLLSQATNVLVFNATGLVRAGEPLIPPDHTDLQEPYADPLPQAIILTAIVITLAIQTFTLVLIYRTAQEAGSVDEQDMSSPETA